MFGGEEGELEMGVGWRCDLHRTWLGVFVQLSVSLIVIVLKRRGQPAKKDLLVPFWKASHHEEDAGGTPPLAS